MGPSLSSTDIANANAADAQRSAADQAVLIEWALRRIAALEAQCGIEPEICPELPSKRMQRLFMERMSSQQWFGSRPTP